MNEARFQAAWQGAMLAGRQAAEACVPRVMVVEGYAPIADGVCGFAWVTIKPATCAFARWLKAKGYAQPAYGGGLMYWVHDYNQSMQRKEAHARAMAEFLHGQELGTTRIYADSRID